MSHPNRLASGTQFLVSSGSYLPLPGMHLSPFFVSNIQSSVAPLGLAGAAPGLGVISNAGNNAELHHNLDSPLKLLGFLFFSVHIWVSLEMTIVSHLNSSSRNLILEMSPSNKMW